VPVFIVGLYVAVALGAIGRFIDASLLQARGLEGPGERTAAVALAAVCVVLYLANEKSRDAYAESVKNIESRFTRNAVESKLGPRPDEHEEHGTYDEVRRIAGSLPQGAIVFADWPQHYALEYVTRVEGGRSDLTVYESYPYGAGHREFPVDYIRMIEDPSRRRPVFFLDTQPPPRAGWSARFVRQGLIEVTLRPPAG
jgi:hypothetical protein